MISIKLYASGGSISQLEVALGTTIDMEFLLPSFDDQLGGSEFPHPIKIPFTNHNRKALNFPEHFNSKGGTIPEHWLCDVYDSNVIFLQDTKLKLLNHNGRFDARDGNSISIFREVGGLGS